MLSWFGDQFLRLVNARVDARLRAAGEVGLAEARRLVPVRTGRLKRSLGYTYSAARKTLTLYADESYAVYQELGTRHIRARPFLRPGGLAAARAFGTGLQSEIGLPTAAEPYRAGYAAQFGPTLNLGRDARGRARTARLRFGFGR